MYYKCFPQYNFRKYISYIYIIIAVFVILNKNRENFPTNFFNNLHKSINKNVIAETSQK